MRPATSQDLAAVADLEARAASHPWSLALFRDSLGAHCFQVLEQNEGLRGFVIASLVLDELELLNLAVDPDFQGQGAGGAMLDWLIGHYRGRASRIFLEVRVSNFAAIGLYRRRGFEQVGTRKGYYPAGTGPADSRREDAWVMRYDYR